FAPYQDFLLRHNLTRFFDIPITFTNNFLAVIVAFSVAYTLAKNFDVDGFMSGLISMISFFILTPYDLGEIGPLGQSFSIPGQWLGPMGLFTAILVAIYCVEMMRFLKAHNIGIRLPDQVPPMIKNSFDLLIPVLVVVLTLYPLSLFIQHHFDMLIPQAIMAIFKPLVSAADSLPAILLAVLIGHLLWFAGIHGAAIVSGMLQMFWLTNLGMNQQALAQGAPLPHIFMEAFWTFFIVVGGSGATMGLVFCYLRSRSAHLRSIGRLSVVPSLFNINEPVIFGTPIVMNPVFFIPFLLAPMVNAVLAWAAMKLDLIGRVISVVPWTAPAPIGGAWALGWDFRAAILVIVLACVSAIIYFPFFKVYEKQLLAQEAEEAERAEQESQQTA
ncbi:PTS transporter subunit EIIC, partial [Klebsiella pneumoniae]